MIASIPRTSRVILREGVFDLRYQGLSRTYAAVASRCTIAALWSVPVLLVVPAVCSRGRRRRYAHGRM